MKLLRSCLLLAALMAFTSLPVQAQEAAPAKTSPTPARAATPASPVKPLRIGSTDKKAKPKFTKAEMEQMHKIAYMVVRYGGDDYEILFELFPGDAPKTVANFIENADKKTYDGMAVHRTIEDYLVQLGDPASKDDTNREQWGLTQEYTIPAEIKRPHTQGAVAMARRGDKVNPDRKSDGTQFYFVVGNMSALNGQYTVFGQVVSGMSVLKKMSRSVHDSNDCPVERISIQNLQVIDHKGPVSVLAETGTGKKRRGLKPEALKGPVEKFIERIW